MRSVDPSPTLASDAGTQSAVRDGWGLGDAWHLLSLDAPSVAVTWCLAFAMATGHPKAPHLPATIAFLGLATWLCYVGDRILDARSPGHASALRARHHFYGKMWREHRALLLSALGVGSVGCVVAALSGLPVALLEAYVALTALSLAYFGWVHLGARGLAPRASKEAFVGAIFAGGCVLPAWEASSLHARLWLAPDALLFAALCWLNCVAIERWEGGDVVSPLAHRSTQWAANALGELLLVGAVASAGVAALHWRDPSQTLLALSLSAAFAMLRLLEASRSRWSTDALRVLADAALLTPLPWLAYRAVA